MFFSRKCFNLDPPNIPFFLQNNSRPVGLGGNEHAPRSTSAGDISECRWTADPVDHFKIFQNLDGLGKNM